MWTSRGYLTAIIIIVCVVTGVSCRGADCGNQAESSRPRPYAKADTCGQAVSG